MKFGICNEMYVGQPVAEVIRHVAGLGYHGIEIAPFTLSKDIETFPLSSQRDIARHARDSGVEIIGLH